MKKRIVLLVGVLAICVFTVSFPHQAAAKELVTTLSNIVGTAEVIKAETKEVIEAQEGMVVGVGDVIRTGSESFVTVTFLPKTYIELAGESQLMISRHQLDDQTFALATHAELLSGHLSKAVMNNLPPNSHFNIVLTEYVPPKAEAFHAPGEIPGGLGEPRVQQELERRKGELVALVSDVVGIVEVTKVGEVQSVQAGESMLLNIGDILTTGKDSYAKVRFASVPKTVLDVSENAEVKIIRHQIDDTTSSLDARVDVLSGHLSRASVRDLPPDGNFEIVLVDFIPLEAEPFPLSITSYTVNPSNETPF